MSRSSKCRTLREIVHSGHKAVDGPRFDDVLPLSPQKFLVEDLLQNRWPQFHRGFQGLAVGGIVDGDSVHEALGVVGLMQSEGGRSDQPRNCKGREISGLKSKRPSRLLGVKAGLAAGQPGDGGVERPEERRMAEAAGRRWMRRRWARAGSGWNQRSEDSTVRHQDRVV